MKRAISVVLSAIIFLAPAGSAFAWGDDGHQTVGKIASLRIKRRTAQKLAQILKPGETLANIATWADTVKDRMGKTDPDEDTNNFLQDIAHNKKNREWHYDDLRSAAKTTKPTPASLLTTISFTCSTFAFARSKGIPIQIILSANAMR